MISQNKLKSLALLVGLAVLASSSMISSCSRGGTTEATTSSVPKPVALNIVSDARIEALIGLTQQFSATVTYSDGSTVDITSKAVWFSSDIGVASFAAGGLARVLNQGTTQITAAWNGMTSPAVELEANGPPMVQLTVIRLPNMFPGGSMQLQAQCMSSAGFFYLVSPDSWISSNPGVATISSTGLIHAIAPGTTDITLSYNGYKSLAYPLTVITDQSTV